uniref:Glucosylceramidase n=1 Tax=Pyrodinium bahamense TaxID=73915 RepID=A0A7S0FHM6_9DINO
MAAFDAAPGEATAAPTLAAAAPGPAPPAPPPPPPPFPASPFGRAKLWQTAQHHGDLLTQQEDVRFVPDFPFVGPIVNISREELGQTIVGFGGAFTEASAVVFSQLPIEQQHEVINAYFGEDGLGYTVGRVHINSCDFSTQNYAFDTVNDDFELWHFDDTVARDARALIPLILRAQDSVHAQGQRLRLLATPWSPPAWMKTSGRMDHSLSPCLRHDVHETWANYISRWISAYKTRGVNLWAITIQNEPEFDAYWEACVMTPMEEADFLGKYLGPQMRRAHPDVLIFVYDHNKNHVVRWADVIAAHPTASQHMDGVAFHWYTGDGFDAVRQVHERHPDKLLLATEATYERHRWRPGATLASGDWRFGEGYAHDIIGDLNAGSVGWLDWNLLLDQHGGPNHAANPCDSALMADLSRAQVLRHPQYYYIGHFSKFIPPGSRHLNVTVAPTRTYAGVLREYGTCTGEDGLQATSFLRPDGAVAVVVLNCGDYIMDFKLRDRDSAALARIPPHAIQTYLLEAP